MPTLTDCLNPSFAGTPLPDPARLLGSLYFTCKAVRPAVLAVPSSLLFPILSQLASLGLPTLIPRSATSHAQASVHRCRVVLYPRLPSTYTSPIPNSWPPKVLLHGAPDRLMPV